MNLSFSAYIRNAIACRNISGSLHNPISSAIYFIVFPLVILFRHLGIKPNIVTFISVILTFASSFCLFYVGSTAFLICFLIAYLLDYVDGSLARLTNQTRSSSFRLDHFTDLIKFIVIMSSFGFYYNTFDSLFLSFLASSSVLYYTLLNHEVDWVRYVSQNSFNSDVTSRVNSFTKVSSKASLFSIFSSHVSLILDRYAALKKLVLVILTTFLSLNGHTWVLLFFLPLSSLAANFVFIYFFTICLYHSVFRIKYLSSVARLR